MYPKFFRNIIKPVSYVSRYRQSLQPWQWESVTTTPSRFYAGKADSQTDYTRRLWAEQQLLQSDDKRWQDFQRTLEKFSPALPSFPEKPSVFFSYAWPQEEDEKQYAKEVRVQPFLLQLAQDLESAKFTVNMDLLKSRFGESPYNFMKKSLTDDFVMVLLTDSYNNKLGRVHMVEIEHNMIQQKRKADLDKGLYRVAPVVIGGSIETAVPPEYPRFTAIETMDNLGYCQFLQTLLNWWGFGRPIDTFMDEHWQGFYEKHPLFRGPFSDEMVRKYYQADEQGEARDAATINVLFDAENQRHHKKNRVNAFVQWSPVYEKDALEFYVGRPELETSLSVLQKGTNKISICGGGGVGKTLLMLKHYQQMVGHKIWVSQADSSINVENTIADFLQSQKNDNLESEEQSLDELQKYFLQWQNENQPVYLFFDDADEYENIKPWVASDTKLCVTTRNTNFSGGVPLKSLAVDELEYSEAKKLLETYAQLPGDDEILEEVLKVISRLPIAVVQVGTWINKNNASYHTFLNSFAKQKVALLEQEKMPPGDIHVPLWVMVSMNLSDLKDKQNVDVINLLFCCAYLNKNKIQRELMDKLVGSDNKSAVAIEALLKSGMLQPDGSDHFKMHEMIQTTLRFIFYREDLSKETTEKLHHVIRMVRELITLKNARRYHEHVTKVTERYAINECAKEEAGVPFKHTRSTEILDDLVLQMVSLCLKCKKRKEAKSLSKFYLEIYEENFGLILLQEPEGRLKVEKTCLNLRFLYARALNDSEDYAAAKEALEIGLSRCELLISAIQDSKYNITELDEFVYFKAIYLHEIGRFYHNDKNWGKARTYFSDSLQIKLNLAEGTFNMDIAVSYHMLGEALMAYAIDTNNPRRMFEAEEQFINALSIKYDLFMETPSILNSDKLLNTLLSLARLKAAQGDEKIAMFYAENMHVLGSKFNPLGYVDENTDKESIRQAMIQFIKEVQEEGGSDFSQILTQEELHAEPKLTIDEVTENAEIKQQSLRPRMR